MQRRSFWLGLPIVTLACAGPEFTAADSHSSEVQGAGGASTATSGGASTTSGGASTTSGGASTTSGGASATDTARACRDLPPGSTSGTYRIDPDGTGPIAPFDATCDMTSDGGGWTLLLNYVHKAGTNPALTPRKDSLPLLGSDTLGNDESAAPANWGHAAPALVLALAPTALRFQGRTSAHERVVDFVTSDKNCVSYLSGGSTSCKSLLGSFVPSQHHTASLPAIATAFMSGKGELAATEFPFYLGGQAHWGIRGEGKRWEVDTTPAAGQLGYAADTLHRVWAR